MNDGIIVDEVIEMAWQDEISFDAIEYATGCNEKQVTAIMRRHLKRSSYQCWRKRVRMMAEKAEKADRAEKAGTEARDLRNPKTKARLNPSAQCDRTNELDQDHLNLADEMRPSLRELRI